MKRAATIAMALSVLAGSLAMADSHHERDERHDRRAPVSDHHSRDRGHTDRHYSRNDHWDGRYEHRDNYRPDYRSQYRYRAPEYRGPQYRASQYRAPNYGRSWGYRDYSWRRGDRLPAAYYGRPYWIEDCPRYGLRYPPRGYHWVRVNHDAVLAAIATGVVLDVVYNSIF